MKIAFTPLVLGLALALGGFGTACKRNAPIGTSLREEPVRSQAAPAGSRATHAAVDVKPGSHEDWCGEHQVPESQCARCKPALVAAFKATGDWCNEHSIPESQCRLCNPSLKTERPPRTAGAK